MPDLEAIGHGMIDALTDLVKEADRRDRPVPWWHAAAGTLNAPGPVPVPVGCYSVDPHADVAQLVEHHLAKVRVAGSNPVVRSIWPLSWCF